MLSQVFAVVIFIAMFVFIVTEIVERHIVSLICALLTIILVFGVGMHSMEAVIDTINLKSIITPEFWYTAGEASGSSSGINWETIVFIFGMMVMVEGMARVGFFRWLCMRIAKLVKYKVIPVFITFMVLSTVLAMFIDSITVILFLAAVTIELSQLLKFNPVPMILSEIFCANLGGSATMCGDPPNIIIGTSLGYSFTDFVTNTGLIAGISLIAVLIYFYLIFKKDLLANASCSVDYSSLPSPESTITDRKGFVVSSVIFAAAIILLITHAQTGLTVSSIGFIVAIVTLATSGKYAMMLLKKVDYKTLLFFIGLFVVIGGLEQTGILEIMAGFIGKISGGNSMVMIAIIIWLSAIASAFVDNIPFATTMIPIIKSLSAAYGIDLSILAWTLAMGTDIGGSATPIGASANVVGIATASREGYVIKWGLYCKKMLPATLMVVLISMLVVYLRYL
ncbi:MAG: citrate transporter [Lachnospiraceae bacterium]|nr:citrate transporter [Lachnospiraceae bacterium]